MRGQPYSKCRAMKLNQGQTRAGGAGMAESRHFAMQRKKNKRRNFRTSVYVLDIGRQ
jgi:hypothetical protein